MSDEQPLDPAARALLASEASRPEAGGEVADRIFERLTASIGAASMVSASSGASGGSGSGLTATAAAEGAPAAGSFLSAKIAALVLGAFAAGIGVGAVGHANLGASAPGGSASVAAERSTVLPSPSVAPGPSIFAAPASAMPEPPSSASIIPPEHHAPPARPPASVMTDKDIVLARERAWLDQARTALARGAAEDAIVALDGHAREFPSGRMAEEREALAVHSLATAGRGQEARTRAEAFRARWPSSVFRPVVERAAPRERFGE